MKRLLVLLYVALATLTFGADFTTSSFHTDIVITRAGELLVSERIKVSFTKPQRGLIRRIPFRTKGAMASSEKSRSI